jgi:hypothetical protein
MLLYAAHQLKLFLLFVLDKLWIADTDDGICKAYASKLKFCEFIEEF